MLETALVLAAIGAIGVAGALPAMAVPSLVTLAGIGLLGIGLAVGLPAGLWYHVILYRFVSPKIRVPRAWWLSPLALHRHLTDAERHSIALWYRIGGLGFALSVAGGLAAIGGLLVR
jgi:hypothetical protein